MKDKNKTKKHVTEELRKLRQKNSELREKEIEYQRAHEREKHYVRDLKSLSDMAVGLVDFPFEENIYQFIAEKLKELVGNCMVIVNSFDEESKTFCVRYVLGVGKHMDSIHKILGRHPVGMFAPINNEARKRLTSRKLEKVPEGFYELSIESVPKQTCKAIEKLLGLGEAYAMGFSWRGKLFASAVVFMRKGAEIGNPSIIETFIRQASVALQRRYAEEEGHMAKEDLERRVKARTAELENINKELQHEISRHRRIEEALQENEQKYRSLIERANDGIAIIQDNLLKYVNPRLAEISGYSVEEVFNTPFTDYAIPEEIPKLLNLYKRIMKGENIRPIYEATLMQKDNHKILVEVNASMIMHKERPAVLVIVRDISERKKIEEALRSSEERLKILFECAPDGYYLNDTKGIFIDGNKAAEEIVGYKKEELIGKSFLKLKLLSPIQIVKAAKLLARNVRGQPTGPDELTLNRKDGKKVTVEIRTFPVKIKGKTLVLGIARDITARKKAEKELMESKLRLQKQKSALEQKNIALREVIAQIDIEKKRIKKDFDSNMNIVISPLLEKLKMEIASNGKYAHKYVDLLLYHLKKLTSSTGKELTDRNLKLTPREIEICNMVKGGLTSKEVSKLLNISFRTVEKHRGNIRQKIEISNKKINLTSFLRKH